jgi:signal transduction histidine kinase
MAPFRDLPIKQKLTVLIIVIAASAVLLSGVGIVTVDALLFHGYLQRDLSTFSQIIADNSTASLAFDDPESARDILAALRARKHLIAACLFGETGVRFAEYVRPGSDYRCTTAPQESPQILSSIDRIQVTTPVVLSSRTVGTLLIVYGLGEMRERLLVYGIMVLVVLGVSSLVVVLLSSKLRTTFVTPILKLADVTASVSETKDYSARAGRLSNDEVGSLATAFNEMLSGIESRDADLRRSLAEREAALDRLAELNRELQKSNEELARSNQDLERFAYIASHDLQEPLRMVTLYSQLLVRQCDISSGDVASYRDYIVGGTRRMHELLADVLAYVEITRSAQELARVDLNVALQKVCQNLRLALDESGGVVHIDPLPVLQVHEAHLISLFQNLIGNSLKYRGPEPPEIHVSAIENNGMYQFSVADNGIGIDPEYHKKIFLAFNRLHGKDIPGTGIGLAICQRIVERYGGHIWVVSDAGKGSTFVFTLPRHETEQAAQC